jgi:mitochondrial enoyl-[acyl-carrier protein] reductase / trans-2-enoyl-CoA reductase
MGAGQTLSLAVGGVLALAKGMPQALVFATTGDWKDVLHLVEEPPAALRPGEVRIKMLAAAVHPSDFGQIAGSYGKSRPLPAVPGREGVGEVVEVGPWVRSVSLGDRVRLPEELGAWREEGGTPAPGFPRLPRDIDLCQLALSFVNPPTAWRILHDFVRLRRGDEVVTNAGKSAVSEALIKLGSRMGLRVYAVVRGKSAADEAALHSWGASGVFDETDEYFKLIHPALALNQIGGESVLHLIKSLREGGTCVTIGGAVRDPVRYPTRELVFNDVVLRGFWMDKWMRTHTPREVRGLMQTIWGLMRAGELSQTVSGTFTLDAYASALEATSAPGRLGKVLFVAQF